METDFNCVRFALATCTGTGKNGVRMVWLKNTLSLGEFFISEALAEDAAGKEKVTVGSERYRCEFDENRTFHGFVVCEKNKKGR